MINEKTIVGAGTEYPLNGMLTLPDDLSKPVPAVVLVHGSGSSNMDEKVIKVTPFKDLAEGLVKQGIASLRYDKRSFAYGRKMAKMDLTVKEETIDDAILAVEILKKDPRIDQKGIFILGHSMGAMLTPRIDAEGADVKGLIMLAGTPYRLEEVALRQMKQARSEGTILKWIFDHEYKVFSEKFSDLYQISDEEAKKRKYAGSLSLYYFKEMGQKTAVEYLLESRKPVLLMQGGRDFQVLAKDDFKTFKKKLAGRKNTIFRLYPKLNHVFVKARYKSILKSIIEYGAERHITEDVISDIAAFVLENSSDTDSLFGPAGR